MAVEGGCSGSWQAYPAPNPMSTMCGPNDSSQRLRAEREMLLSDKMLALGRLAASVAHEVRNPLGAIDIQLQLLQEELRHGAPERAQERLHTARAELRRLDSIVRNFLRFSRPPALHLAPVEPGDLLRRLRDLVEPEAREQGIALQLDCEADAGVCDADENLLSQAFLNVLINSFQAIHVVGASAKTAALVDIRLRRDPADAFAVVEISDTGCGIPPGDLERVFEYYYTTKDTGTGLGLSIAQRIIDQHGGSLEVQSQLGTGTTVAIRLPLSDLSNKPDD